MSRSNPTTHSTHPCTRWHEWNGELGEVTYYDKSLEKTISLPDGFTFMLLDQLSTIKGWHDASDSGIHSNEVRDTKQEVFIVKAFKGGILAEGHYAAIRDRVQAMGGKFVANCYIAFRDDGELKLGSIQFKGAALSKWMDFCKENNANNQAASDLFKKAIQIKGFTEGKKGRIVYRTPNFHLREITEETNEMATQLDIQLQSYLAQYFNRPKAEQASALAQEAAMPASADDDAIPMDDDTSPTDIPFN